MFLFFPLWEIYTNFLRPKSRVSFFEILCVEGDKNTQEGGLRLPGYSSKWEKASPRINLPAQETV